MKELNIAKYLVSFDYFNVGFQVLIQAVEQLIRDEPSENMNKEKLIWLYTIMLTATGVKLVLWIYCRSSGNRIVRAYAKVRFSITLLFHIFVIMYLST